MSDEEHIPLTLTRREIEALRLCVDYVEHQVRVIQARADAPAKYQYGCIWPPLPALDAKRFPHVAIARAVLDKYPYVPCPSSR